MLANGTRRGDRPCARRSSLRKPGENAPSRGPFSTSRRSPASRSRPKTRLTPSSPHSFPAAEAAGGPAGPGPQKVRIVFDEPQRIRRVQLVFEEPRAERTQEFALSWIPAGEKAARSLVRQQYTFSPGGATREVEEYTFDLEAVAALELEIVPDIGRGAAVRLAGLSPGRLTGPPGRATPRRRPGASARRREFQRDGRQQLGELLRRSGAGDRRDDAGTCEEPGEGDGGDGRLPLARRSRRARRGREGPFRRGTSPLRRRGRSPPSRRDGTCRRGSRWRARSRGSRRAPRGRTEPASAPSYSARWTRL